jgi:hypothetical protein
VGFKHLVGLSMDFMASGRTRAEAVNLFLSEAVEKNVIVGLATNGDLTGGAMTAADVEACFESFSDAQLAKPFSK